MKLHHFALFFAVIAIGFFVTAQIGIVTKLQEESRKKTEYDCLVAAVDATVEVVFDGRDNHVTESGLMLAEEVFFQTLAVLHDGSAEKKTWELWRDKIPCLVVFAEDGYYQYRFTSGVGYSWSELIPYVDGEIPASFFSETEKRLSEYCERNDSFTKKYRMENAREGIWERGIVSPCVFAVYAPEITRFTENRTGFLYAASGRRETVYYVTEDNYCHLSFCEACKKGTIVARYTTQKESAEDGAMPCELCMK